MGNVVSYAQSSFNSGELSPRMLGRSDHDKYKSGLQLCENAIILPHGGTTRRPGFEYIHEVKDSTKLVELVPFEYSEDKAYALEFGDLYMRVFMDGGIVVTPDAYTVLLLHCDGSDGGITFTDDSPTIHTVTPNGNAQVDTAAYYFATGSLLLDGTGDYLSVPDHANFFFDNAAFTIDTWVRFDVVDRIHTIYYQADTTAGDMIWLYYDGVLDVFVFRVVDAGVLIIQCVTTGDTGVDAAEWHHVAVVNDATNLKIYVDGVEFGTIASGAGVSIPNHDQTVRIGGGIATTTALDFSSTCKVITANNGAFISSDQQKWGDGSLYTDGVNDYWSIPDHADFDVANVVDSTIDLWVKFVAHAATHTIVGQYQDANNYWTIRNTHATGLTFLLATGGTTRINTLGPEIADSNWHHIAVVNDSDHWGLYLDGVQQGYAYEATDRSMAGALAIGALTAGAELANVFVDDLRITNTNSFSVNPATWLLDSSGAAHGYATAAGQVYPSYTGKWGSGGFYFDGTNDYISYADHADWDVVAEATSTVDFWAKLSDHTGNDTYIGQLQDGNNYWEIVNLHGTGLQWVMATGGAVRWTATSTEISDTNWHHFALINSGDKFGVFLDGAQVSYAADTNNYAINGPLYIGCEGGSGRFLQGYIDEIRITHSNVFNVDCGSWLIDSSGAAHSAPTVAGGIGPSSTGKWGTGSFSFDGVDDYLSFADHADWDLFNEAHSSVDMWFKLDTHAGISHMVKHSTDGNNFWRICNNHGNWLGFQLCSGGTYHVDARATEVADTDWHHLAVVNDSDYFGLYLDGVQVGYGYYATDKAFAGTMEIGNWSGSGGLFDGYIDEFRLMHSNPWGVDPGKWVTDSAVGWVAAAQAYAAPSTTYKWGNGSLFCSTASGKYLRVSDSADWEIGNETNFTVDMWVKSTDHTGSDDMLAYVLNANNYWEIRNQHGSGVQFLLATGGVVRYTLTAAGAEITDNNWHHIAVIKVDHEFGIYRDGVQYAYQHDANLYELGAAATYLDIGSFAGASIWDGYIDELRITHANSFSAAPNVGMTNTITVPTAAHTSDANTVLLMHFDYDALTVPTAAHTSDADTVLLLHADPASITVPTAAHTSNADTVLLMHADPETLTIPTTRHFTDANTKLLISSDMYACDGHIDEFRVSKGIARWTAAFTLPTQEYPAGGGSTDYELATLYTEDEVADLRVVQGDDILYIAHPSHDVYKLERTDDDAWTITEITWEEPPWNDVNTTATTLDSAAVTGTDVALVASAPYFSANMVGAYFKMKNGWGRIDQVTDATNARWDIINDLDDHNATATWYRGAWDIEQGYPSCIAIHEDRLILSGVADHPLTVYMSRTGDYDDFGLSSPVVDTDSLTITIWSQSQNAVKWLQSGKRLYVGTVGAEFWVSGATVDTPIAPDSVQAKPETRVGSEGIAPLMIDNAVIFVQDGGERLRLWSYTIQSDGFESADLSLLSEHMTASNPFLKIQYAKWPHSVVWCTTLDGTLLGLTIIKEHQIVGWHKHTTGTTDSVESIAVIPGDYGDELWMVVARSVNGSTVRYVERMSPDFFGSTLPYAFFVDSGLTYAGAPATVFYGLDNLENETVQVIADGIYVGDVVIATGSFTLDTAASVVTAGLGYNSNWQTVPYDMAPKGEATTDTIKKRIFAVMLKLYETSDVKMGRDSSNLVDVPMTDGTMYTDWYRREFNGENSVNPTIYIRQDKPLPATILSLVADFELGGR